MYVTSEKIHFKKWPLFTLTSEINTQNNAILIKQNLLLDFIFTVSIFRGAS